DGVVSAPGWKRVSRVYSPVDGSMLSVSSSTIPSSPVTGVHRSWLSEVSGFQYGVVDFAIPWSLVSRVAAASSPRRSAAGAKPRRGPQARPDADQLQRLVGLPVFEAWRARLGFSAVRCIGLLGRAPITTLAQSPTRLPQRRGPE